ncbi:DUF551 domain-containing protein [Escherichia coli]|nr:DUF551 domain-containing protein [Escherichia coli]
MSTLTKEWLLKTIAELEEERDATPGAVNEDAAMALAAMKLALASLEAEAVAEVCEGFTLRYIGHGPAPKSGVHIGDRLYTAPPASVSVPDERQAFNAWNNDTDCPLAGRDAKTAAWLAWNRRAAMLQGAEPVTTVYKLRDAVEIIRNSGIEIDAEKILAERDDLDSSVIPDGWVACSERMPEPNKRVFVSNGNSSDVYIGWIESEESRYFFIGNQLLFNAKHWMETDGFLPAAPQQEVNNDQ